MEEIMDLIISMLTLVLQGLFEYYGITF